MKTLSCKGSAPSRYQRFWALAVPFCAVYPLLIGSTAAAQEPPTVIPIGDCNSQFLGNGEDSIFWTSSFSTDDYDFDETSRSGSTIAGDGETLEVVVQWSTTTTAVTSPAGFGPRGGNYSPAGVGGVHEFNGVTPQLPLDDPSVVCPDVDTTADSYNFFTFLLTFTSLNGTGSGGLLQKGNSQWAVDVDVGDGDDAETVSLGVNVHVATGVDPDE